MGDLQKIMSALLDLTDQMKALGYEKEARVMRKVIQEESANAVHAHLDRIVASALTHDRRGVAGIAKG